MRSRRIDARSLLLAATGIGIGIGVWIAASLTLGETRVPSPWHVIEQFVSTALASKQIEFQGAGSDGFVPHVLATLARYGIGTISGLVVAMICLFLISRFPAFGELFNPLIEILRAIPPLALAPFFLLWFGTSQGGPIAIVSFYVFTMIFVAGAEALRRQNPVQQQFAQTLGASRTTISARVVIPELMPAIAGPIRVAFSWSWGLVIVSELLGAQSGIGRVMNAFIAVLSTDLVVVGIIWVLVLALVVEGILELVLKRTLSWHAGLDSQ